MHFPVITPQYSLGAGVCMLCSNIKTFSIWVETSRLPVPGDVDELSVIEDQIAWIFHIIAAIFNNIFILFVIFFFYIYAIHSPFALIWHEDAGDYCLLFMAKDISFLYEFTTHLKKCLEACSDMLWCSLCVFALQFTFHINHLKTNTNLMQYKPLLEGKKKRTSFSLHKNAKFLKKINH
ncbi:hypothetical protein ACJX0J_028218, partial [Zea mays]